MSFKKNRNQLNLLHFSLAFFILCTLPSCGNNGDNGKNGPPDNGPDPQCFPPCREGKICDLDANPPVCVDDPDYIPPCFNNEDCEEDMICIDGECINLCIDASCGEDEICNPQTGECVDEENYLACSLSPDPGDALGASCRKDTDCNRGICVPLSWTDPRGGGTCRMACFIEVCPEICPEYFECGRLPDREDPEYGWEIGACVPEILEGNRKAFQSCGRHIDWCTNEDSCFQIDSDEAGTCLPVCGDDWPPCPEHEHGTRVFETECLLESDLLEADDMLCVIQCQSATDCPGGLECVDVEGISICLADAD